MLHSCCLSFIFISEMVLFGVPGSEISNTFLVKTIAKCLVFVIECRKTTFIKSDVCFFCLFFFFRWVQIATQIAVLTAKIARLDCPRYWDSLLSTLLTAVRCDELLIQERALLVLHHVTKTLASKRLAPDRKLFEEVQNGRTVLLFFFFFKNIFIIV